MGKNRVEAFSDGVLAIVITIMVLELKVPSDVSTIRGLEPLLPTFSSYVLSFLYLAIYWNNHHHLLHSVRRMSAPIMWANMHLLFWLSLIPFVTGWMGANHYAPIPTALYGVVLLGVGVAYRILQLKIIASLGRDSPVALALGPDWKGKLSIVAYAVAVPLALSVSWMAGVLYALVAIVWLVPDRRIERALLDGEDATRQDGPPSGG